MEYLILRMAPAQRARSAQITENVTDNLTQDRQPEGLEKFKRQLVWFAPKGECDEDSVAVVRTPNN